MALSQAPVDYLKFGSPNLLPPGQSRSAFRPRARDAPCADPGHQSAIDRTAEFDQRADDVSVDHANVIQNYRSAHAISVASGQGQADTEALRRAMTQNRELFDELLGGGGPQADDGLAMAAAPPAAPPAAPSASTGTSPR